MRRSSLLSAMLGLLLAAGLSAQNPADLSPRDKTEVFIQHLVKVAKIDPARYRAMVLEYELSGVLWELSHAADEDGKSAAGHEEEPGCCTASGFLAGDFIESALQEIYPDFARARGLRDEGKLDEARDAARALSTKSDPYLAAYASLLLAETEHARALAAGAVPSDAVNGGAHRDGIRELHDAVMAICERIGQKDRLYLVQDHRACELIALSFEKLGKPLHELLQYSILLTDYNDLPPLVAGRAKARLAALEETAGKPLGTVAGWMNKIEKLLAKELTGKDPTQAQETEVASALDKLIELQEARERKT
ncbi:MAG: hypothetical protein HY721_24555 [Planctomycetes bacterium]|nr:hypothetical protein [Planctomycetota bacterium]